MNDDELIRYFRDAVHDLTSRNNPSAAREKFTYALSEYGSVQADLLRGIAACDLAVRDVIVEQIYDALDTFGLVSLAVARSLGDEEAEKRWAWPHLEYDLQRWGIIVKLTSPVDVIALRAWIEIKAGRYDKAKKILDSVDPHETYPGRARTEVVDLILALLYYETRRWSDAVEIAEKFRSAPLRNDIDEPASDDTGQPLLNIYLVFASAIIAGTGLAHLGNTEAAAKSLELVLNSDHAGNFPKIAAEAMRVRGLIERAAGREEKALSFLASGRSLDASPDLCTAIDDPRTVLSMTRPDLIDQRTSYWDADTEPALEQALAAEADTARVELLKEADDGLARQIGMPEVKEQVSDLKAGAKYWQEMRRRGVPEMARSGHLVFSGPPGTGKTTVARIISKMYAGLGVTRTDNLVEVQRADLEAKFEGHTSEKTQEVIKSALGGVLFIDEAYALIQDRNGQVDPFGQQIVEQLLLALEEHRNDLIVIIAGYEDQLRRFIATNEGLKSRFTTYIKFSTYTPLQIGEIARVQAQLRRSILEPAAEKRLVELVSENMTNVTDPDGRTLIDAAGNGRFARNVIERAERYRERRLGNGFDLSELSDEQLFTLTIEDVTQSFDTLLRQLL